MPPYPRSHSHLIWTLALLLPFFADWLIYVAAAQFIHHPLDWYLGFVERIAGALRVLAPL